MKDKIKEAAKKDILSGKLKFQDPTTIETIVKISNWAIEEYKKELINDIENKCGVIVLKSNQMVHKKSVINLIKPTL
jgi:hypothetical protein